VDAGSATLWNAAEPLGLLNYEEKFCSYSVVVTGLKKNFQYKWKLTVDNAWKENYGKSKFIIILKSYYNANSFIEY
jgi:aminopeptidase C